MLTTGAYSLDAIIMHLAELDISFVPLEPPELRDRCAQLSKLLAAAAAAEPPGGDGGDGLIRSG